VVVPPNGNRKQKNANKKREGEERDGKGLEFKV
jgi:hypothetical protein